VDHGNGVYQSRGSGLILMVAHSTAKIFKGMEPLLRFLAGQIRQIREGGLPLLLRKVTTFLMMVPAPVILLAAYMARPLVLIRFGVLAGSTLGAFAGYTELYLCNRDAGIPNRRTWDIFYYNSPACNKQLGRMWDRTLRVSPWAKWPSLLASVLPGFSDHVIPIYEDRERDIRGLLARTPPHLSFNAEEERLGQAALRELGIPEGAPYICFLARDSAYKDLVPLGKPSTEEYRNSSIHSFVPAVEELTRRGYFALRMGAIVNEALRTTNPMIVDYATKHRTDFLDIYLAAKCRFYLGDANGYMLAPVLFRRPLAITNCIPSDRLLSWDPNYLLIHKKLWLRQEHRFLTFWEMLDIEGKIPGLEQAGIEVVDSTPEEIAAVAVQMDERLNGTWRTTEEDEELQRRFWSLFETKINEMQLADYHGVLLSRIGAEFLRQNKGMLE